MVCLLIFYELFIFLIMSLLPILFFIIPSIQHNLVDLMLLLVGDTGCRVTRLMMIMMLPTMGRLRPLVGLQHQVVYDLLLKAVG